MKRTSLTTYKYGRTRRVYMDDDGSLYYRFRGMYCKTYIEYCMDEKIEEYIDMTNAIVRRENEFWIIDLPEDTYRYSSLDEMIDDIKINLEEIKRFEKEWQA